MSTKGLAAVRPLFARRTTFRQFCTFMPPRLQECLGCPFTKKPFVIDKENKRLISVDADVAWKVDESGMPDLLPWSGSFLDDSEDTLDSSGEKRGDDREGNSTKT